MAVDFTTEKFERWTDEMEDCQVCRFRLDGVVYVAIEDPDDGYRSHMRELIVQEGATMTNVFPAIDVECNYRIENEWNDVDDILEIVDTTTGKIVLEVGTSNTDDYYPSFVASFHPENMATNIVVSA
ncbi:hypothetical protein [Rhizobium rhizogenes]|uniref:hypothetical protein n=1 Tax=Rhizobium rhizogenes TaxID=359 RepID=UPI0015737109|nr:hypothetical protein [Rhizobium rhizogenes]NTF69400.1 hypothetical protein [Rhizobium rhizogenes]